MFLANGEVPLADPKTGEDWSEEQVQEWVDALTERHGGTTDGLIAGGHYDDCELANDELIAESEDCYCGEGSFSMQSCQVCGSSLGGDRYIITWITEV